MCVEVAAWAALRGAGNELIDFACMIVGFGVGIGVGEQDPEKTKERVR